MNRDGIVTAMADIALPPAPDWRPIIAVAALVVLTLALAGWVALRRRARRAPAPDQAEAVARLDRLRQAWLDRELDEREAGYRLATLLRLGLGLHQLRPEGPPPACGDTREWADTVALLQRLRYRRHPDTALSREVFERARRWLTAPPPAEDTR